MRRHVIVFWTVISLASISVLFQNCGKYKPELEAASGYKAGSESSAGNPSSGLTEAQIDQLRTAQVTVASHSNNSVNNVESPEFTFSLSISSIASYVSYSCKLDNSNSWVNCTNPLKIENLDDGIHSLAVRATYQGVPSLTTQHVWTRDTLIPNLFFNRVPPSLVGTNNFEVSFSASDAGSGIKSFACNLNEQGWQPCTSPRTFSNLTNGSHIFRVQAFDQAETKMKLLRIGRLIPNIPISSLPKSPAST